MSFKLATKAALAGGASLAVIALVAFAGQETGVIDISKYFAKPDKVAEGSNTTVQPVSGQPNSDKFGSPDRSAMPAGKKGEANVAVGRPLEQLITEQPAVNAVPQNSGAIGLINMYSGGGGKQRSVRGPIADPMPILPPAAADRERFPDMDTNPLRSVADHPVSTFSVDVDTASYAYLRAVLNDGRLPKPDAVRTEELINYFDYAYDAPKDTATPFLTHTSVVETPWNKHTKLMHIGIQGYTVDRVDLPPQNLVFLIDTSGSMKHDNKLRLLQQAFRMLVDALRPEDEISIVTYAGNAGVLLEPTRVSDAEKILRKIKDLTAGGRTAGHAGLKEAYAIAEKMAGDHEQARVILATDGDFNVGLADEDSLKRFVSDKRKTNVSLSVLGFGRGNYNDALMQTLAQNGNGVAAYIDSLSEARKVLVDQVAGSLQSIAQDVKIQVEFNPATVAEYRLIGYETRRLNRGDFNNDKVDAGDIGAGHSVTAIYEVTPVGSPSVKVSDLRYQAGTHAKRASGHGDELAFVKLRYKRLGEDESMLIETPVTATDAGMPRQETLFAASVAAFGQLMRGSDHLEDWDYDDVAKLAQANRGPDTFGYRAEFLKLIRLAELAKR